MFFSFKFCWIINRIGDTIFKRRPQSKIRICLSSALKMPPKSISSHQTNKQSQNKSEKKNKRENYRNRFHFRISLVSTAQFRQTKIPSQETRDFKKIGKFWSESFCFYWKGFNSLTFSWARNLKFCKQISVLSLWFFNAFFFAQGQIQFWVRIRKFRLQIFQRGKE